MADEKKPKIDLKARLGKTQVGAQTPPPAVAGIPAPPAATSSGRVTPTPPPGLPVPPGTPVGPPPAFSSQSNAIDPSNPLAAVAAPYRAAAAVPVAPPQPQRIEVDEGAVHEARKGARKMGLVLAVIAMAGGAAVGFVAGQSTEAGKGRTQSKADAADLAKNIEQAKTKLDTLNAKLEAGAKMLMVDHKFPDTLAKDLGGLNIDFDGSQLAGRRFSGFPAATTQQLVDFIQSIQALNDRKLFVQNTLTHLQKPITEQLSGEKISINLMVVATKDGSAIIAPLVTPIPVTGGAPTLPKEYVFTDPGHGNGKIDAYKGGDLGKGAGFAVTPSSFNAVCPSDTQGQIKQLGAALSGILKDIQGEKQPVGDIVQDTKAGLIERAGTLATALHKIAAP